MLHDTSAIHAELVNERHLLPSRQVHLQEHSSVAIVEVPVDDIVLAVCEDGGELGRDGVAALRIVGAVLDKVGGDVGLEGIGDILLVIPGRKLLGSGGWKRRKGRTS